MPEALIVRSGPYFGPWGDDDVTRMLDKLRAGLTTSPARDLYHSVTYLPDLVNEALDLLIDGEHGIWHLTNGCSTSWADVGMALANLVGVSTRLVHPVRAVPLGLAERRPVRCVLSSERGILLRPLEDAFDRLIRERNASDAAAESDPLLLEIAATGP